MAPDTILVERHKEALNLKGILNRPIMVLTQVYRLWAQNKDFGTAPQKDVTSN